MSGRTITIEKELPHRSGAPLGNAFPFLLLDWSTRTWFRFNILSTWILLLVVIVAAPDPAGRKLGMLAVSPIAAVMFYFAWIAFMLLGSFVPVLKVVLGFAKLAYYYMFSRLIVQPVKVDAPIWH